MECLSNLIGIKGGCGGPEIPSSGLYINDLPAITIKTANATANAEQKSGYDLLVEKLALADKMLEDDVRNHLAPYIQLKTVVDSDVVGRYQDDLPLVASESGYYKGIQLKIDEYPYLSLDISSIRLQLTTGIDTNVYIIDLITGKILDTLPITTVADEITEVIVNKTYKATRQKLNLLIAYNAGDSDARKTLVSPNGTTGCSTCRGGWGPGKLNYVYFRGASLNTSLSKTNVNVQSSSTTAGLSLTYSLNCDPEPFICAISSRLAMPKLFKAGSLIMQEMIFSDRLNHTILVDREDHRELRDEYDREYMSRLSSILENMVLPKDFCFGCRPPVRKVVQVP